jgi:hypothetical protein
MIHFSSNIEFWSPAMFWYVAANMIVCLPFTAIVIIGGISDLRYLLRSLGEEEIDETDDGRVEDGSDQRTDVADHSSSPTLPQRADS